MKHRTYISIILFTLLHLCLLIMCFSGCTAEPKMYLIENASADTLVIEASYTPVESFWYSIKPFTKEAYDQHVYLPKSKKSLNGGRIDFFSWGDVLCKTYVDRNSGVLGGKRLDDCLPSKWRRPDPIYTPKRMSACCQNNSLNYITIPNGHPFRLCHSRKTIF